MNPQCLRALVVLLASIALMPALAIRPAVELPSAARIDRGSGHRRLIRWSTVKLDTFEQREDIALPDIPLREPPAVRHPLCYREPGYFDSNQLEDKAMPVPQRGQPILLLSYELPDACDAPTPARDDIVIPPVPPPKTVAIEGFVASAKGFQFVTIEDAERYKKPF